MFLKPSMTRAMNVFTSPGVFVSYFTVHVVISYDYDMKYEDSSEKSRKPGPVEHRTRYDCLKLLRFWT